MKEQRVIKCLLVVMLLFLLSCSFPKGADDGLMSGISLVKKKELAQKVFTRQVNYMESLFAKDFGQLHGFYNDYYRGLVSIDSFVAWEGRIAYDYTFPEAFAEMTPPRIYTIPKGGLLKRISYDVKKVEISSDGLFGRIHVSMLDKVQVMAPVPPMNLQSDRLFYWKSGNGEWFLEPIKFVPTAASHISGGLTKGGEIRFPEQDANYEEIPEEVYDPQ